MSLLTELLTNGPNDPLALAGLVILLWLPLCAIGLSVLWLLAQVQEWLDRRKPRRPAIVVPPADVRPLAGRRYANAAPRSGAVVNTARVTLVVAVVAAFTAFLLVTNASTLRAALGAGG